MPCCLVPSIFASAPVAIAGAACGINVALCQSRAATTHSEIWIGSLLQISAIGDAATVSEVPLAADSLLRFMLTLGLLLIAYMVSYKGSFLQKPRDGDFFTSGLVVFSVLFSNLRAVGHIRKPVYVFLPVQLQGVVQGEIPNNGYELKKIAMWFGWYLVHQNKTLGQYFKNTSLTHLRHRTTSSRNWIYRRHHRSIHVGFSTAPYPSSSILT